MSLPHGPTRPVAAYIVQGGIWLLAIWNAARAIALQQQADWLTGFAFAIDSRWRMALAWGWAALLALAAAGLWRRRPWSRWLVPLLLFAFGVFELGMLIAFSPASPAPLPTLAYAAFAGFAAWALWRPAAGSYFRQPIA
jgi:hypothetical protein